jgi:creatinine amidohydrolase/Fe(II)-dependent formamide hydrolase-like protein
VAVAPDRGISTPILIVSGAAALVEAEESLAEVVVPEVATAVDAAVASPVVLVLEEHPTQIVNSMEKTRQSAKTFLIIIISSFLLYGFGRIVLPLFRNRYNEPYF